MTPIRSINDLFSVLAGTYGTEWQRQLDAAPKGDVKSAWMHQLERFSGSMHCIQWALENLPERCPNPVEFRNLCRQAPAVETPTLPEPKADPVRVAAELSKLQALRGAHAGHTAKDGRAWARAILGRIEAGQRVSPTAAQMAQSAMGLA